MKKVLLVLSLFLFTGLITSFTSDNTYLVQQLEQSRDSLLQSVKGLSEAQLQYKAAPDRWSIAECVEHILVSEKKFMEMNQELMKAAPNPEARKDIKLKDEDLVTMVKDRSQKAKAPEFAQPKRSHGTGSEVISAFTAQRDQLISYVKNTPPDDFRNHVFTKSPVGTMDAYQLLLLDASHTIRHTRQIEEVKADPGFPK